jgi:hypothetical protein
MIYVHIYFVGSIKYLRLFLSPDFAQLAYLQATVPQQMVSIQLSPDNIFVLHIEGFSDEEQ